MYLICSKTSAVDVVTLLSVLIAMSKKKPRFAQLRLNIKNSSNFLVVVATYTRRCVCYFYDTVKLVFEQWFLSCHPLSRFICVHLPFPPKSRDRSLVPNLNIRLLVTVLWIVKWHPVPHSKTVIHCAIEGLLWTMTHALVDIIPSGISKSQTYKYHDR